MSLLRQQYNHTVSNVAKVFECMNIVFLSTHLFLLCAFFYFFLSQLLYWKSIFYSWQQGCTCNLCILHSLLY